MSKQFKAKLNEKNNPNKTYIEVYNGLMDSLIFDGYEKVLLINLIAQSTAETNAVNTVTISIKKLCRFIGTSKPTVYKYVRKLEEKGVLIKQNNSSQDNGNMANTYRILNYDSVWDCKTLEELKEETDKIKDEVLNND